MKKVLLLMFFFCLMLNVRAQYVVGYYYFWGKSTYPHTVVEYKNLTHIVHAFIFPASDGSLSVEDDSYYYPELIKKAHDNGVKILTGIGGYGNCSNFSSVVADTAKRRKFISNVVNFCLKYGYDGADLDWEYPKSGDNANLVKLVTEMRTAFNSAGIQYITAALPATDWNNGYNISLLKDKLDWFALMTYDFSGPWEAAAYHNSPLYSSSYQSGSIDNSVKSFVAKGVPKNKLLIGTPFYGYNLKAKAPYASHTLNEGVSVKHSDIAQKLASGWVYNWDESLKVPYLQDKAATQFLTYDDTNSVKYKSDYILKNNLQGTIVWELRQDYNGSSQPLLRILGNYLLNHPDSAPVTPSIKLPSNGASLDTNLVVFNWEKVYPVISYNIQVSYDSLFATLPVNRQQITFNTLTVKNMAKGKTYYWRVSANNSAGTSAWSEVNSFKIQEQTVSVNDEPVVSVPKEYLLGNYPNPFNPNTIIQYSVPAGGNVNIQVFDIIGKKIETLVDEYKPAGTHEVHFDGKGLSSGVYFYQLRCGRTILTRKMVLNK